MNIRSISANIAFAVRSNGGISALPAVIAVLAISPATDALADQKILIAYFSNSGTTAEMARKIHDQLGGELYEIKLAEPYPTNGAALAERARREVEKGPLPVLDGTLPTMNHYDLVLVGAPVWWNTLPAPLMSFLKQVDFKQTTVAGFATYSLSSGTFFPDLKAQARNAVLAEGLGLDEFGIRQGQVDDRIGSWIRSLSSTDLHSSQ
ncbi:flavodoxin [Rhizobium sp. 2MFCol3.1]|uniref:flavodoxin n=1 Tax=Rhizobium sp. 2MFCol3.1 TaxID=1246459 RepID=UPI0003801E98|nr:flavodoxin [Rhizobium sp. 2MFCol3.1]